MTDIKMSDAFKLPLKGNEFLLAGIEIDTDSSMDELAMTAINAYDENQERIKQLEERIKQLEDALLNLLTFATYMSEQESYCDGSIDAAKEALNNKEQK